ncbi:integrase catalytic domain-containing protein [Trichonephila clavipes]|nr:integrase catalytic domain-containing protein [Trichonephila clavipes]
MIKLPDHTLAEFLTNESIEWNFIPPRSPNHGKLWEAGVKAFKFHLKRVVGNAHLTLEEFITILCEIEAVLNSRPLTPLTSDFDDFETLTPGHFLVGRPLTSIVEPQITNINENQLSRWERVKKITQHIYRLWKRDYLNNLQERHKWKFNKNNVSVGTLVLIKDENLPSTKWSTGRITEIFSWHRWQRHVGGHKDKELQLFTFADDEGKKTERLHEIFAFIPEVVIT